MEKRADVFDVARQIFFRVRIFERRRLAQVDKHRFVVVIQDVELAQVRVDQAGFVQFLHVFHDGIEEFLRLLRVRVLQARRGNVAVADKLHDEHVVHDGARQRDAHACLAGKEQIAEFALRPEQDHTPAIAVQRGKARVGTDVIIHAVEVARCHAVNLDRNALALREPRKHIGLLANADGAFQTVQGALAHELQDGDVREIIKNRLEGLVIRRLALPNHECFILCSVYIPIRESFINEYEALYRPRT